MIDSKRTINAVILDWAGTTVDHGSLAPTQVFQEIFRGRGIKITIAEAREPMGRAKRDHIAMVAAMPRVAALWQSKYSRLPTDDDVDAMYRDFLPLQKSTLASAGSEVIRGVPEAVALLRQWGIKIGSSTGYTRELMHVVAPLAAKGGYWPEVTICSDDVPAGRPAPWMNFLAAQRLNAYPMDSILVVDDTIVGIEAGRNAGAITVGITQTGNALGLSESDVAAMPQRELRERLATIEAEFLAQGADFTLPSVAELPHLVRKLRA
jgi:phosphonoacetaldehyde hydrolase